VQVVRYGLPVGLPGQARGPRTTSRAVGVTYRGPRSTVQGADRIRCVPTITNQAQWGYVLTFSVGGRRNLSRGLLGLFATTPRVLGGPRPPKSHPAPGKRPLVHGPVILSPCKFIWVFEAQDRGPRGVVLGRGDGNVVVCLLQPPRSAPSLLVQCPQIKVLSNVRRPRLLVQGWPVLGVRTLVLGLYSTTSSG